MLFCYEIDNIYLYDLKLRAGSEDAELNDVASLLKEALLMRSSSS